MFLLGAIAFKSARAGDLKDKIAAMAQSNAKSYISPFVSGFGVAMNSGIFHSAETHAVLGFDIQPVIAMAFAGSSEKTYSPKYPSQLYDDGGKASTAIGSKKSTTYSNKIPGQDPLILPGGAGVPAGASGFFVAPQLTVGVPYKTDIILRYVPGIPAGKVGKIGLFGLGAKHNINQWLPMDIPVDLAGAVMYQKLSIGKVFSASALSFDAIAGKSLNLVILKVSLYGGFGVESSSMDIKYTPAAGVVDPSTGNPVTEDIKFSLDGKNSFRGLVGANIRLLWLVNVNAEASIGKYKSLAIGVGFGLR